LGVEEAAMNVVTLASRKGGAGKSTLTAHLASCAHAGGYRTLVIDADPQGSLSLWHSLRRYGGPTLQSAARGIERAVTLAGVEGYQWVFIDTAPTTWVIVQEAIRAATLVLIPARPGIFDLNSVRETIAAARERGKPFAVVLNAAPVRREDRDAPALAQARTALGADEIPVWSGQISQRAAFAITLAAGASVWEAEPESAAAAEMGHLWSAVVRSVEAVNAAHAAAREKAA
jgi:chromosome partitioning protein